MLDRDAQLLTVTDLKQYDFCARVLFYERCLPHFRPRTYKMDAGRDAHEHESKLAARRTLSKFGLASGERQFDVRLTSNLLSLNGIIDEVIVTESPIAAYPVEYKLAKKIGHHNRLQLAVYALMIEENWQIEVSTGYIYLILSRQVEPVAIDSKLRDETYQVLGEIRAIIEQEWMPPPTQQRKKCLDCEFRRVCNDV